jgi:2'-hydroxyisoflavone reductase
VLAPDSPNLKAQFIDVRDLAKWIILAAGRRLTGPYNVTGPEAPLPFEALLETCREVSMSDATFTWVSEAFLGQNEVRPFTELPLWLPRESQGIMHVSIDKAQANGLAFRPLEGTVRDTLEWAMSRPGDYAMRNGLSPDKERALLSAWRNARS